MIKTQEDRVKCFLVGLICSLFMVNEVTGAAEQSNASSEPSPKILYRPPNRGMTKSRIGGGTRSLDLVPPVLILAPNHLGVTSQSQPRLYWYIFKRYKSKTQLFELSKDDSELVEFSIRLPIQNNGGMQSIDLAKYDVHLKPDVLYSWKIIFLDSSSNEKLLIFSGGNIQFVGKNQKLIDATPRQLPYLAAEFGLWYDALDGISVLIDSESNANYWILQRAYLLDQADLGIVAMKERLKINANH